MKKKFTHLTALLALFTLLLMPGLGWAANIIPVRTDVSGFSTWTDNNVGGTTYLQLLVAGASTISPAMNFDNYTNETLDFKARTFGGSTAAEIIITVSISTNNGVDWTILSTRTPSSTTLTAMTQFDLSAINGSQVKIKFSVAGTDNTIGVGIDDITIAGTSAGPPVVTGYSPANGATGVTLNQNLILTFDKNVQAGTSGNIIIYKNSDNSVFETIPYNDTRISYSTNTVTINPNGTFASGTKYYVQISSNAIQDGSGSFYAGISNTTTWAFTTVAPIVTNVTSTNANGTYKIGDVLTITVTFDNAVTVTGSPYILLDMTGTDRQAGYSSGSATSTLSFTYTIQSSDVQNGAKLDYVATTSLQLNSGTINSSDGVAATRTLATPGAAGSLSANKSIVVDGVVPTVSAYSPLDNATGIAINTNLVLTMSENVQKGTGNIYIKKTSDNSTVQTIDVATTAVTIAGAAVTIDPADLGYNTDYYITIDAGAIKDMAGNNYAGLSVTTTWNFVTVCAPFALPFAEGFNAATIPLCWSTQPVVGSSAIQYVVSSTSPTTAPQEGTYYVYWNSFSITSGNETRLISPGIVTTGVPSVDVKFYWNNENSTSYNSGAYLNEGVLVQYSTDGTTWTDPGTFYPRHDGSLASGTNQWNLKTLTLPSGAGNQPVIYVSFKFHSSFGHNCSLDNLVIAATSSSTITTGSVSAPPFCVDATNSASGTVAYSSNGTYSNATFTAYISDATGTFAPTPPVVGTATAITGTNPSGNINITIPAGTVSGTGYKIRIDCVSPAVTGTLSSAFEVINGVKDVLGVTATPANASAVIGWTNPVACYDDVLIVAKASSSITAAPSGNSYTANLVYGTGGASAFDGGYVVYQGTGSPQTITGLTNGTVYYFKLFTRKGTNWSAGIEVSSTPKRFLVGWDMSGQTSYGTSPLAPSTTASNITVGSLTKASGMVAGGTAAARGWGAGTSTAWSSTAAGGITANTFFTFTVKANAGYTLSLDEIDPFDYRRSGTGPASGLIQYSLDGTSFTDIATVSFPNSANTGAQVGPTNLTGISALQNLPSTTTVTFRIIPYNGSTGSTWYIFDYANSLANDFGINGSVCQTPVAPTTAGVSENNFCSNAGGTISLSASGGSGTTLKWYSGSCGGTPVGTGTPLVIAKPTTTTTYYARWETADCGNSTCASVQVNVTPLPIAPASAAVDFNNFCANAGGSISLSATGGSGTTLAWYAGGCGSGTSIGLGTPLVIAKPTSTTTYYARWENACGNSTCANVTVTVNPLPAAAGTISGTATVAQGNTGIAYTVGTIANATSYTWVYSGTGATINGSTNSITIDFANNATGGNLTVKGTNGCGDGTVSANYPIAVTPQINWCNLQSPSTGNIALGSGFTVYARVYEEGVTPAAGADAGIQAWIGYSTSNSDPSGGGWTWVAASFNVQAGNNDEYMADLGAAIPSAGNYYFASRFQLGTAPYVYGGTSGFWTTGTSGTLTVYINQLDFVNLQYPATGTITVGGSLEVFAQVYEPGVTPAAGQGAGIQAWIGYSATDDDPATGTGWTWVAATFNVQVGNNDEYKANIGSSLPAGTYYYASRFKFSPADYQYGGQGGAWSATNKSGILTVNYGEKVTTTTGAWTDPIWSPPGTPAKTDNVTILHAVNIPGEADCRDLTIGTGGSLLVKTGGSFIPHGSVTGDVSVELGLKGGSYFQLFTPPVSSGESQALGFYTGAYLDKFDEPAGEWYRLLNGNPVPPMVGYSINYASPKTLKFTGSIYTTDRQFNGLTALATVGYAPGWNLVGNPFTSAVFTTKGTWASSGLDVYKYVWDATNSNYLVAPDDGELGTLPNNEIPAMQGFFVHATGAASLTVPADARDHGTKSFYKSAATETEVLRLSIEGNSYSDKAIVAFNPAATRGFDGQYDAYKLMGGDEAPQLYSMLSDGQIATVNSLPSVATAENVPLGLKVGKTATYTLTVGGTETFDSRVPVRLDDLKLGTTQDLRLNPVYTFTASPGDAENRLRLRFATATGIDDPKAQGISIFQSQGSVVVRQAGTAAGTVYVYSATGALVASQSLTPNETRLRQLAPGVYLVKVVTGKAAVSEKVVISQNR